MILKMIKILKFSRRFWIFWMKKMKSFLRIVHCLSLIECFWNDGYNERLNVRNANWNEFAGIVFAINEFWLIVDYGITPACTRTQFVVHLVLVDEEFPAVWQIVNFFKSVPFALKCNICQFSYRFRVIYIASKTSWNMLKFTQKKVLEMILKKNLKLFTNIEVKKNSCGKKLEKFFKFCF